MPLAHLVLPKMIPILCVLALIPETPVWEVRDGLHRSKQDPDHRQSGWAPAEGGAPGRRQHGSRVNGLRGRQPQQLSGDRKGPWEHGAPPGCFLSPGRFLKVVCVPMSPRSCACLCVQVARPAVFWSFLSQEGQNGTHCPHYQLTLLWSSCYTSSAILQKKRKKIIGINILRKEAMMSWPVCVCVCAAARFRKSPKESHRVC